MSLMWYNYVLPCFVAVPVIVGLFIIHNRDRERVREYVKRTFGEDCVSFSKAVSHDTLLAQRGRSRRRAYVKGVILNEIQDEIKRADKEAARDSLAALCEVLHDPEDPEDEYEIPLGDSSADESLYSDDAYSAASSASSKDSNGFLIVDALSED